MGTHRTLALLLACTAAAWTQSFSFNPGAVYPAGSGTVTAAQGDFNGDGKIDIAVGNAASNTISIFLGNGDGTFTPGTTISVPGCLVGFVGAGNFDRDGHTDLLAACEYQNSVYVLPGQGNGKFGAPISTTLPGVALFGFGEGNLQNIAVADFNNDGVTDLVLVLADSNLDESSVTLNLLLGNGDGTFQSPLTITSGTTFIPSDVMVGDFDRDGNQDLAVSGALVASKTPEAEIFLGTGTGSLQMTSSFALPIKTVSGAGLAADVNGDGLPDIVLAGLSSSGTASQGEILVYIGAGDGTFKQTFSAPEPSNQSAVGLVAADLRGTGHVDLVEAAGNLSNAANSPVTLTLEVRAGNGDGTFQSPTAMAFPSGLQPWPGGMLAGFWTGRGLIDLAFAALPANLNLSNQTSGSSLQDAIGSLQALPAGDLVAIVNGTTPTPTLSVSQNQLQFNYVSGGTIPARQSVTIANSGAGTLNWTAVASSPWLAISPSSGQAPSSLSIAALPGSLTPGTYTGTVQISAAGATGSPGTVNVTLTISPMGGAPVVTGVVNGASFQPGFESGSWVTIQGSNLSNTNPGRTWTPGEIVNGNLPTSLDGTSVTIDGTPAYVYYISPTQLNVQAPTASTSGTVAVVVTNNSLVSASFNAQLTPYSPAFFLYSNSTYAIATNLSYALVGNPNTIPGTIAAHPGDVLILWGTGFGLTTPVTPAGIEVTGAPAVATLPSITVGGTAVTVLNAVLSPGSAGLYQVAIQLPASVPTGVVGIQASVGGVMSPGGISLYVSGQ